MTNSPGAERLGANDWAADRSKEDYGLVVTGHGGTGPGGELGAAGR